MEDHGQQLSGLPEFVDQSVAHVSLCEALWVAGILHMSCKTAIVDWMLLYFSWPGQA